MTSVISDIKKGTLKCLATAMLSALLLLATPTHAFPTFTETQTAYTPSEAWLPDQ